jgi:choline dehydrogenase
MQFDFIVVGGGSAGCAMASRLAENGRFNILLIEAGPSDHHGFTKIPALMSAAVQSPDFDWRYRAEPDSSLGGRADIWPAGKCLGGGSAINGMTFVRGHRADYDRWAQEGAEGWDYKNVMPYFKRMETNERGADHYRGGEGPLRISEGRAHSPLIEEWIEAAIDFGVVRSPDLNGAKSEGVDFVQVTQKNGVRHSAAAAYLDPALKLKNLEVVMDAQVTRIRFDGRKAIGVDYVQHGQARAFDVALVVVCAGALNSPRLLMLSGIGPAAHLRRMEIDVLANLLGVGQNLQDHPSAHLVHDVNTNTLNTDARGLGALKQALDFALTRQGVLTASLGHAQAFLRTRDLTAPNVHLVFAAFAFDVDDDGNFKMRKHASISTRCTVCRPRSRGEILLRSSDVLAPPVIRHTLLGDDDDVEELVEAVQAARKIVARPNFAKFVAGEVQPGSPVSNAEGLRDYLRKSAAPSYHFAGTCKMGVDAMAVVDPQLKVRGVEGLWVADASVMPSLPAGDTNATAIMIGDKGSYLVKASVS